jgi:UDP-glucose 4-epimerase
MTKRVKKPFDIDKALRAYRGKTVLVTGSSGFIGSTLVREFCKVNCRLVLLDKELRFSRPKGSVARIVKVYADVTHAAAWDSVLKGVDFVFHLAALEYDRKSFDVNKDIDINALSVIRLLQAYVRVGCTARIIFSSSANLFGLAKDLPVNENTPTDVVSLWSAHKHLAENYFRVFAAKHTVKAVILRLANVYGPAQDIASIMNVVINQAVVSAIEKGTMHLFGNSNCVRDYLYVDDAVTAFIIAGASAELLPGIGPYVIGTGEGKTIAQVWQIISEKVKSITGRNVVIGKENGKKLEPFDMRDFMADSRLFTAKTGWKPLVSMEKGVELTVNKLLFLRRNGWHSRKIARLS